jgi:predicted DNA-binding WGR domain protein
VRVHGVSLHYFNSEQNNDKFYRAFVWRSQNGVWNVTCHWGRDGAPSGQTLTTSWNTLTEADRMLSKKVDEKLRKGYEYLGQGEIEVSDVHYFTQVNTIGDLLHRRVGRQPTKLFGGFSLIIREEDYIEDLI